MFRGSLIGGGAVTAPPKPTNNTHPPIVVAGSFAIILSSDLPSQQITMSTIFERIIAGELPAKKVYEDDTLIGIMDIHPLQKGHVLIITKTPYHRMEECDDDTLAHAFLVVKKMMKHMKKVLGVDYVEVVVEGVEVPHFHIKLIPSMIADMNLHRPHVTYAAGEIDEYQQKLIITN